MSDVVEEEWQRYWEIKALEYAWTVAEVRGDTGDLRIAETLPPAARARQFAARALADREANRLRIDAALRLYKRHVVDVGDGTIDIGGQRFRLRQVFGRNPDRVGGLAQHSGPDKY